MSHQPTYAYPAGIESLTAWFMLYDYLHLLIWLYTLFMYPRGYVGPTPGIRTT